MVQVGLLLSGSRASGVGAEELTALFALVAWNGLMVVFGGEVTLLDVELSRRSAPYAGA